MQKENRKFILNIASIALVIYGVLMLPSLFIAERYAESGVADSMLIISGCSIMIGLFGHYALSNNLTSVSFRVCYITTLSVWIGVVAMSVIPYLAAGEGYSLIDCIYTATASLTTCSTSAIPVDTMPIGLLFWKSTCNWVGGIGIILLVISFLPEWQNVGQKLVSTEIRGPGFLMSNLTFRKAYRRIIFVYFGITLFQYIALRLAGFTRLTALITTLSNTSTSGVEHLNGGVITAYPAAVRIILSVFAFISSINISIFVLLVYGRFEAVYRNTELRFYLLYIITASLLMIVLIDYSPANETISNFGDVLMQTVSFTSTSGFIVSDCAHWPPGCISVLIILMFTGSCAISSGGGIKISRISLGALNIRSNLYRHIHPHGIRPIHFNNAEAKSSDIARVNVYILLFMTVYFVGALLITIDGTPVMEALCYSQSMLTNTGTSIFDLSNPGSIEGLSNFSKCVLSFLMLCGRLEIYPVLLLFTKGFWNSKNE